MKWNDKKFNMFLKQHWIEIILLFGTPIIVSSYGITEFPILKDMGFFSYLGQEILRGYPVYSTAFEIKPPLIPWFYALSMSFFNFLPQYLSIRVFMLIVITLMVLLFYNVILKIFNDKIISTLSVLILISFTFFIELSLLGDSRTLALFFCFLTFFLLFKRHYLLSGISASFSFLFYQITGLFLLAPLIFIFLDQNERKVKIENFGKTLLGFFIPLILLISYFFFYDSVTNLINFSLIYPLKYESSSPLSIWKILNILGYYCSEFFFLLFGFIGFLYFFYKIIKKRSLNIFYKNKYLTSFFASFLLLFLFLFKYLDNGAQFVVVLPFISVLAAFILKRIHDYIRKIIPNKNTTILLILIVCFYGFLPALQPVYPENLIIRDRNKFTSPYELIRSVQKKYGVLNSLLLFLFHRTGEEVNIEHQLKLAEIIKNNTNENEKILSLTAPEILFLSQRRNLNSYPLFEAVGFYEISIERGELNKIREEIIKYKPKFILAHDENFIEKLGLSEFVDKNYKELLLGEPFTGNYKVYYKSDMKIVGYSI